MRKQILALMDSEESYAVHFMEHVNRKKTTPFEVHAFTEMEKLQEYAGTHRIEILLISEHDLQENNPVPAAQTVVLTEGADSGGLYPNVCKYQASSAIMREVMEVYGRQTPEEGTEAKGSVLKPPMKIIGVFSPVGRCMKTSFALALGQCLARTKATLYMNFEASGGLRHLLRCEWERDISDVIYYIRRGDRNITARLLPLIREIGSLGFVPPSSSPAEICAVTAEEWALLFSGLRRDSSYEVLILDLGDLPLMNPDILEECDLIYMPVSDDEIARAKLADFRELLQRTDEELVSRVIPLKIRAEKYTAGGKGWAERLPFGPVGKFAEERILKDRL